MSPAEVWVRSGLLQGQRLRVQQTWVWQISSTIKPPEFTQDWGNRTLEEHKQKPVCTRTQEKGAVTPQETDPDLPVSIQESLAEVWVIGGLLQGQAP